MPREFKVFRGVENDPTKEKDWRPLRKSVADIHRRAEIGKATNSRYIEALASISGTTPLKTYLHEICRPITKKGIRYRAIHPMSKEDGKLLELISQGEFVINGFRNRDLRSHLFNKRTTKSEQSKQAGKITRKLRLLRAHGIIKKVSRTHRYLVTTKGRVMLTALLAAGKADVEQLTKLAA